MKRAAGMLVGLFTAVAASWTASAVQADDPDLQRAIETVLAIGREGNGNTAAIEAMKTLSAVAVDQIPVLLEAMDTANPIAANYLRSAIEKAQRRAGEFPLEAVHKYLNDREHSASSRVYAYDLVRRANPQLADEMIPQFVDDPALLLRRIAIKKLLADAEQQSGAQAIGTLGYALSFARDVDQINATRDALAKHNVHVDLARQLGFILKWHVVGPFDHTGEANFATPLGPELALDKVDVEAEYDGKVTDGAAAKIQWKPVQTSDPNGIVSLNDEVGKLKSVLGYAFVEFDSAEDQDVLIKLGTPNANKVWVNGEQVIAEEIYHVGMDPDQFSGAAKLRKGKNQILVKLCQNDQAEPWAQDWMFQLRICDLGGKSVHPVPPPAPQM